MSGQGINQLTLTIEKSPVQASVIFHGQLSGHLRSLEWNHTTSYICQLVLRCLFHYSEISFFFCKISQFDNFAILRKIARMSLSEALKFCYNLCFKTVTKIIAIF